MTSEAGPGGRVGRRKGVRRKRPRTGPTLQRSDADAVAVDFAKQLIALAAGVLALSGTFITKIATQSFLLLVVLAASWALLLVSIFCGLQTMSAIILSRLHSNEEWSKGRAKRYAWLSKWAFFAAVAVFALYAFLSVAQANPTTRDSAHTTPAPARAKAPSASQ